MIPKIIHYCWFGRNPLPPLAEKCISSWKKHCPEYIIIEWNEDNFDIAAAPLFVRQAYELKKWAFVTDYVRLFAMTTHGGIYMDTDVELVKPLDPFLHHDAFSGFEDNSHIPTGIMACIKGFPLFCDFLKYYDKLCFVNPDGSLNNVSNVLFMTEICLQRGLVQNNTFQIIENFALYPNDFFCPVECQSGVLRKTKNTVAIHWFMGSWLSEESMKNRKMTQKKIQHANLVHNILHIPNRILRFILGDLLYEKLKKTIKGNT